MAIDDCPEETLLEESPVVKLVNLILRKSCSEDISEVYLEPAEYYLNIRGRRNGETIQLFDPLPRNMISAVVNRLKIMSGLDITIRNRIQEGKIRVKINDKKQKIAIKTIPVKYGEKVALSLLDKSINQIKIEDLITNRKTLEELTEIFNRPSGILIVSGPTNSGKTITCYAILARKNKQGLDVCTVEEQIKYSLPDINQVELSEQNGINYETVIQSFLMENRDVIFVEQVSDLKTAKTLIEAAVTGHLVLTNISAHDTVTAIAHLNEIGLPLSTLSDTLIGVINQRLIGRLCPECRVAYTPNKMELAKFGKHQQNNITLYRAKVNNDSDQVCIRCKGTGYHGLIGIYEVLQITKQIRALMAHEADYTTIKNTALQEGMTTLFSYGLDLVLNGETTLEELERMFPQEFDLLEQEAKSNVEIEEVNHSVNNDTIIQGLTRLENQVQILTLEIQQISNVLKESKIKVNTQEVKSEIEITPREKKKSYEVITDPW